MFGFSASSKVKKLVGTLDTTDLRAWNGTVNDLARLGAKAVPGLIQELQQHPQDTRSPDVLVMRGECPVVVNCELTGLIEMKPGQSVSPEFAGRVVIRERKAEDIVAVGKNRQYGVVRALGKIRDRRAFEVLVPFLKDANPFVSSAAAKALGSIQDPRAVDELIGAIGEKDEDSLVADAALRALVEIACSGAGGASKRDPSPASVLLRVLKTSSKTDRRVQAAVVLACQQDAQATGLLIELAANPEPKIRCGAILSLGRLRERRAVPAFMEALRAVPPVCDATGARAAALALAAVNDPATVEPLIELSHSGPREVRCSAAVALGWMRHPQGFRELRALADEADDDLRGYVLMALGASRDDSVTPLLRDRLRGAGASGMAALGLALLGTEGAVKALMDGARSADAKERGVALVGMARVRSKQSARIVEDALRDSDSSIRFGAAFGLYLSGLLEARDRLGQVAEQDADEGLRRTARTLRDNLDAVPWGNSYRFLGLE